MHRNAWGTLLGCLLFTTACSGTIGSPLGDDPTKPGTEGTGTPSSAPTATTPSSDAAPSDAPPSTDAGAAPAPTPAPTTGPLDIGATDTTDDLGFDFAKAHVDGLTRTSFYAAWRDLEPSDGVYRLTDIDDMTKRASAAGLKLSLEIEITNTDCVDYGMTDAFCVASKFPADLPYSRTTGFADPNVARRLAGLVTAIANRYDASVLTHVFVGNEVDRYIQVVLHDSKIDLSSGFAAMLATVRSKLPAKRPKLGTVVEFQPSSEYLTVPPKVCPSVDVVGLTMYPTEPDAEGTDPATAKIQRWMNAARTSIPGACSLAITEVGASALAPYGTPADQQAVAASIIDWLRAHRGIYDYATWFAMADNPDPTDSVFGGMGLETRAHVPRPAYATWLAGGK